ncbi:Zinc-specific metallo-regulatory protein [compost metagenome]
MKILLDAGDVKAVELPGEATRYESAHRGHHHHFHCNRCQKVFPIPGCPPNLDQFAPKGYEVSHHELTLYGTCAQCVQAARQAV